LIIIHSIIIVVVDIQAFTNQRLRPIELQYQLGPYLAYLLHQEIAQIAVLLQIQDLHIREILLLLKEAGNEKAFWRELTGHLLALEIGVLEVAEVENLEVAVLGDALEADLFDPGIAGQVQFIKAGAPSIKGLQGYLDWAA